MRLGTINKPVLLVPGFGGSKLVVNAPEKKLLKPPKNDFINLSAVFTKQWEEMFNLKFDIDKGVIVEDSIDAYDFGGVDGVRNLCEDCSKIDGLLSQVFKSEVIVNLYNYRYFDTVIDHLMQNHDYEAGLDLCGIPYDFRKIMVPSYLQDMFRKLKLLIEERREVTNKPCVVVAHSLGCLFIYLFLVKHVDHAWKQKHIDKFISISAPYGGCSIALKTILSGLPRLSFLKDKYYSIIKNSTGLVATLPNTFGFEKDDVIIIDKSDTKTFTVNDFMDILPESTQFIWENNIKHNNIMYSKNTGVKTIFVVNTDKPTDYQYLYNLKGCDPKTQKIDEPITTITKLGDTVVHKESLLYHAYNSCMYDNYSIIEVPNTEHSKILDSDQLCRIISDCLL